VVAQAIGVVDKAVRDMRDGRRRTERTRRATVLENGESGGKGDDQGGGGEDPVRAVFRLYWCGVPQEVCNRWEDNGHGRYQRAEGRDCQYKGVLVGGLCGLVRGSKNGVAERWVERLVEQGVDADSIEGLVKHLGRKQALECVESNRLVEEFCWVTRLIAE
jgi:hypothetical protein